MNTELTLGPLLYHWTGEKRRDFYARIADEAPIDTVYLGEVICSKRLPFIKDDLPLIKERLEAGGKKVVLSTLAFVTEKREMKAIREACDAGFLVEANDVSCLRAVTGRPHVIGPLLNVFNEGALDAVARKGAVRVVPPPEVSAEKIATLAKHAGDTEIEAFVFGRQVLSIAMRCYHARASHLHKDNCQFACEEPADGLPLTTLANEPFGMVNGTSVMSHGYVAAFDHFADLKEAGVTHFRLSPQDIDMVHVSKLARDVLDGKRDPASAREALLPQIGKTPLIDGYLRGSAGRELAAG